MRNLPTLKKPNKSIRMRPGKMPTVHRNRSQMKTWHSVSKSRFRRHCVPRAVGIRIKNISEKMLVGPIRLVVEGTSVPGLSVQAAKGTDDASQPFIELLAEGKKLAPDASTRSRRVVFRSKETLSRKQRGKFEVQYHVTRSGLSYADREHNDKVPALASSKGQGKGGKRPKSGKGKVDQKVVQRVIKIQDRWTDRLMKVKGVIGTSTALDARGRVVVRICALDHGVEKDLPRTVDGIPTQVTVTWPFRLMYDQQQSTAWIQPRQLTKFRPSRNPRPAHPPRRSPGRPSHGGGGGTHPPPNCAPPLGQCSSVTDITARHPRPIPIGSQIFNVNTFTGGGCSVGTFGAAVTDGTRTFLLSNNHVLARLNDAQVGERIVQSGCNTTNADTVGTLLKMVPIVFSPTANNRVDCALALSSDAEIDRQTACSAYGGVRTPVQVKLEDKVQKIGRTTGLQRGTVTAINVTAIIGAPGKGLARFVGQIKIGQAGFSAGGDSGSLIVLDPTREAVGLLFAGSPSATLANPILEVETALGVKIKCAP
jgi:hypothetical protein